MLSTSLFLNLLGLIWGIPANNWLAGLVVAKYSRAGDNEGKFDHKKI